MQRAGLADDPPAYGKLTVFAPTNRGLQEGARGDAEKARRATARCCCERVLLYHVVAGNVKAKQVVKLRSARTVAGPKVRIRVTGKTVRINTARVAKADVMAIERRRARDRPRAAAAGRLGDGGAARELGLHSPRSETARGEQDVAVEPEVGELLDQPLVRSDGAGERRLEPLLADLAGGTGAPVEQLRRRPSGRSPARLDRQSHGAKHARHRCGRRGPGGADA